MSSINEKEIAKSANSLASSLDEISQSLSILKSDINEILSLCADIDGFNSRKLNNSSEYINVGTNEVPEYVKQVTKITASVNGTDEIQKILNSIETTRQKCNNYIKNTNSNIDETYDALDIVKENIIAVQETLASGVASYNGLSRTKVSSRITTSSRTFLSTRNTSTRPTTISRYPQLVYGPPRTTPSSRGISRPTSTIESRPQQMVYGPPRTTPSSRGISRPTSTIESRPQQMVYGPPRTTPSSRGISGQTSTIESKPQQMVYEPPRENPTTSVTQSSNIEPGKRTDINTNINPTVPTNTEINTSSVDNNLQPEYLPIPNTSYTGQDRKKNSYIKPGLFGGVASLGLATGLLVAKEKKDSDSETTNSKNKKSKKSKDK